MADLAAIEKALRAADAAGNHEDAAALAKAYAAARGSQGDAAPPQESAMSDVAKSIPSGLAQGAAGVAGLPGDLRSLANTVGSAANKVMGGNGDTIRKSDAPPSNPLVAALMMTNPVTAAMGFPMPTSGQVNKTITDKAGDYHKPQTTAGEYAQTISSFAPNALAPGGLAARAARVAVPGAASETAGQLTKGKPYEGLARAAGGFAGGVGEGMAEGALSKTKPPAADDLKGAADKIYKSARSSGVEIDPNAYDTLVGDIGSAVKSAGTHPKLHPKVAGVLESLEEAKTGAPLPLDDLERLRRIANGAAKSIEPDERRVAGVVLEKIDDFMDNLSPAQVTSGDPAAAGTISEARGLWSKMRKSEVVTDAIERAKDTAAAQNGNMAAAIRSQFQALAKNKKAMRGFSAEERDAIKSVARVGALTGPLAAVGAFRPRGLMGAVEGGLGASHAIATGDISTALPYVATAAAGQGAQLGANALTSRNARLAAELMRGGSASPGATGLNQQTLRSAALSTLLSQAAH